jgi:hypothetical protein
MASIASAGAARVSRWAAGRGKPERAATDRCDRGGPREYGIACRDIAYGDRADLAAGGTMRARRTVRLLLLRHKRQRGPAVDHCRNGRKATTTGGLPLLVRCDSLRAGAHRRLTCLDREAGGPQEEGSLLAHGVGWMSPYQGDRYFEYGVLDRA